MNTSARLREAAEAAAINQTTIIAGTAVSEVAAQITNGVSDLASLPEVAQKVVDIAADPKATADDLADIFAMEPALAAKLLKLANSAFYGLPSRVGNIHRAIVVLGFKTVQHLALAGSLCPIFRGSKISKSFTGQDLWKHCLAVAVASRNLAKRTGYVDPDEAFLSGITHDVGILALRDVLPRKLARAIENASKGTPFLRAEQEQLATDHTEVGLALTSLWRFPEHLRHVCRYHHAPSWGMGQSEQLCHLIHLADWLCHKRQIGFNLAAAMGEEPRDSLDRLGLKECDLDEVSASLDDDIHEAESIFD